MGTEHHQPTPQHTSALPNESTTRDAISDGRAFEASASTNSNDEARSALREEIRALRTEWRQTQARANHRPRNSVQKAYLAAIDQRYKRLEELG